MTDFTIFLLILGAATLAAGVVLGPLVLADMLEGKGGRDA